MSAHAETTIKLTPRERELLIERAAIIEYDGNLPRAEAERLAKADFFQARHKELLASIHKD